MTRSPNYQIDCMTSVVVHYKELALKGRNRPWFIRLLVRNLRASLAGLDIVSIRSTMGRVEIELGPAASWADVRPRLSRVFGVANFSAAGRSTHDFASVASAILTGLGSRAPESFRVSATRADKRLPFISPQVEREIGGLIKEARGWRVDLDDPAFTVYVEMLPEGSFYFFGKEPGAGGLPTGTGGRVACLLSGGIDSPVAAYRMMRRGCSVLLIHFHAYPILSRASQEKVREIAALRIAERLARAWRARALVTGEVIGQVASQTLENMTTIAASTAMTVFRPLVGMDKDEISAEAERIGTFPISIIPDQDCCTLFTPRHPATRARPEEVTEAERALPIDEMVATAVTATSVEDYRFPALPRAVS